MISSYSNLPIHPRTPLGGHHKPTANDNLQRSVYGAYPAGYAL